MRAVDAISNSPLFPVGETSGSYKHTPEGSPRAAVVAVFGWEKNAIDVTAVTYGGKSMSKLLDNIPGTAPYPYSALWLLDNIPSGEQTITITKNSGAKVRLVTLTLNATGEVTSDEAKGNQGTNKAASIPSIAAKGNNRLEIGIIIAKYAGTAKIRTTGILNRQVEGEMSMEVCGFLNPHGRSEVMEWEFAEAQLCARTGAMLSLPGVTDEPEGREFLAADGSQPSLIQWPYIPALTDKCIAVNTNPDKGGIYIPRFIRGEGEELVALGNRAEANSNLTYGIGTERWFRLWRWVNSRNEAHFNLFWQLHDQSGGSPPVCLLEEGSVLYFGPGSGGGWFYEGAIQPLETWWEYKVFSYTHTTEGEAKLWINGTLVKTKTGVDTAGEAPVYDKTGIYRSSSATGETNTEVYKYEVWDREPPVEAPPSRIAMIV